MTYTFKIQADTTGIKQRIADINTRLKGLSAKPINLKMGEITGVKAALSKLTANMPEIKIKAGDVIGVGKIRKAIEDKLGPINIKIGKIVNFEAIESKLSHLQKKVNSIDGRGVGGGMRGSFGIGASGAGSLRMFGGIGTAISGYLGYQGMNKIMETGFERERMGAFIGMAAGSKQEATGIHQDLIKMAAVLGSSVSSLGQTFGMLSQVSSNKNALELTKRIGMISAFSGYNAQGIGINLMQMMSAGKGYADMMDIRQLREKYPLFTKYIAQVKGTTQEKAEQGLKRGRYLTGDESAKAFGLMTGKGSELEKWFDTYQKGFLAKWNTMRVEMANMAVAIYGALKPALEGISNLLIRIGAIITEFTGWLNGASESSKIFKSSINGIIRILVIAIPLLVLAKTTLAIWRFKETVKGLNDVAFSMKTLATNTGLFVAAIAVGLFAIMQLHDALRDLVSGQGDFEFTMVGAIPIITRSKKSLAGQKVREANATIEFYKGQGMKDDDPRMIAEQKKLRSAISLLDLFTEKRGVRFSEQFDKLFKKIRLPDLKLGEFDWKGIGGDTPDAIKDAAMDTSNLYGAHGGLGESRIIHMHFNKALVENNIANADAKTMMSSGETAADYILRIVQNVGYKQSYGF